MVGRFLSSMLEDWTGDCRGQFSLAFLEMTAHTLVGGRNDSNVSNPKPKKVIHNAHLVQARVARLWLRGIFPPCGVGGS